jgi:Xaa-Pro aminopeptidase/Xaa-Pro dipeptidase
MEGLGEDLVGYDTETVRPTAFGPSNLRLGKRLRAGMVLTVEPGAYLIGPLIERFAAEGRFAGFWDYDALAEWVGLGGVRIEDVAIITEDAVRVLGPPIPKSLEAVEAAMAT